MRAVFGVECFFPPYHSAPQDAQIVAWIDQRHYGRQKELVNNS